MSPRTSWPIIIGTIEFYFAKKVSATTDWADERSTKEQAIANSKRIETEGHHAGLYGHTAGYRPLDVAEETLDKIYEAYDIPDSLPGYPTLTNGRSRTGRERNSTKWRRRMTRLGRAGDGRVRCSQSSVDNHHRRC